MVNNISKSKLKISAVVVNYNSGSLLRECMEGLLQHLETGYDEIIVVDNQSTDGSLALIEAVPGVRIIRAKTNTGYGGGCNLGFEFIKGDILLFLNPDIKLISPVICVREEFEQNADCAVVAPGIIEQDNLCKSLRPLPTIINDALSELGINWANYRYQSRVAKEITKKSGYFHGYAQGSAFFVRRKAFTRVGKFDADFFLYYEEVELFKRFSDYGYRFIYDTRCTVSHSSGGSSGSLEWRKTAIRYNSKLKYFSKHSSKLGLIVHKILILTVLGLKLILYLPMLSICRVHFSKLRAYIYAIRLYIKGYTPWRY